MSIVLAILVIGVPAFFFTLLYFVALFEQHRLEQFRGVELETLPEQTAYFRVLNQSAQEMGFEFVGAFQQQRGSEIYRAYYTLWLSPDQLTLARVIGGKVLKVTHKKLLLTSFLTSNRLIESADYPAAYNLSGTSDRRLLLHAHMDELYAFHKTRLGSQPIPVRPFQKSRAFDMIQSIGAMQVARLKELGLARFTNAEQTEWRFTAAGAWRVCAGFFKHQNEALAQKERAKLKRPGD